MEFAVCFLLVVSRCQVLHASLSPFGARFCVQDGGQSQGLAWSCPRSPPPSTEETVLPHFTSWVLSCDVTGSVRVGLSGGFGSVPDSRVQFEASALGLNERSFAK